MMRGVISTISSVRSRLRLVLPNSRPITGIRLRPGMPVSELALAATTDNRAILTLAGIDDLFFEITTVGTLHTRVPRRILREVGRGEGELLSVQREGVTQLFHSGRDPSQDRSIRYIFQGIGNEVRDLSHLVFPHPPGRNGRRPDPNA